MSRKGPLSSFLRTYAREMDLLLPSVKLAKTVCVGSKVQPSMTPHKCPWSGCWLVRRPSRRRAELIKLRQSLDPLQLGKLPRCVGEGKNTTRGTKRLWVSGYISNASTIEPRVITIIGLMPGNHPPHPHPVTVARLCSSEFQTPDSDFRDHGTIGKNVGLAKYWNHSSRPRS
jgi:hypothetical protein